MSHFTMPLYRALESNMGARKDRACEGAMHSPWSEVGTFLVARQGHLTQCMHCTPLYDRWTAQISLRDLGLNGAWKKKKSFDIYLYGHKEKLFIFLIMFTPAKNNDSVFVRSSWAKGNVWKLLRSKGLTIWLLSSDLRYGWFKKKYPTDWFWGKKKYSKEIPGLKKISLVGYNPVKNLTLLYSAWQGKKNYISRGLGNKKSYPNHNSPPPPPLKRQMFDP